MTLLPVELLGPSNGPAGLFCSVPSIPDAQNCIQNAFPAQLISHFLGFRVHDLELIVQADFPELGWEINTIRCRNLLAEAPAETWNGAQAWPGGKKHTGRNIFREPKGDLGSGRNSGHTVQCL